MSSNLSFQEQFRQFYISKNIYSCYELSNISEKIHGEKNKLTQDYLSHLNNKPILNPRQATMKKLAEVFASASKQNRDSMEPEEMEKLIESELREVEAFFAQARQQMKEGLISSSESAKEKVWKITLETDINDFSEISEIMKELERLGNGAISVKQILKGSIILELKSSAEVLEQIQALYESGQLREVLNFPVLDLEVIANEEPTNLTQWFENIFTSAWQRVEELLTPEQLRPAYFSESVQRAKRIDLQIDLIAHTLNLVVSVSRENVEGAIANLKVFPTGDTPHLPPNLKLIILVEGEVFKEVTSRSADQYIQCEFEAEPGDEFVVKLALGEAEITEDFVV